MALLKATMSGLRPAWVFCALLLTAPTRIAMAKATPATTNLTVGDRRPRKYKCLSPMKMDHEARFGRIGIAVAHRRQEDPLPDQGERLRIQIRPLGTLHQGIAYAAIALNDSANHHIRVRPAGPRRRLRHGLSDGASKSGAAVQHPGIGRSRKH